MRLTKLFVLVFPVVTSGLSNEALTFSVNYFAERNTPFVCLISCGSKLWDVKFTREAAGRSMSVAQITAGPLVNLEQCVRQHSISIGVLMDAQCDTEQILYTASENMYLDLTHIWLIFDEADDLLDINTTTVIEDVGAEENNMSFTTLKIFNDLNLSVDADIVLAIQKDNQFNLYEFFNFGKVQGGNLRIKEIGYWKDENNNNVISELNKCKYYRRWDFGRLQLRIISVALSKKVDQELLADVRPVPGISPVTRTSTRILLEVAEIHNIKFVHTITDRWIGEYYKNSSRVVSTALYFREQDITSVLRLDRPLYGRVTFLCPAMTSIETRYYYRIPTTGPGKYENQFLRPLTAGAWCGVLGVSALCAAVLIFSARLEARPSSFQYGLFSVTASVCQQFFEDDTQTDKVSTARKFTIFITGVCCVLVYNYYTSSVVSWLLNGPPPSINSLEELLESPLELIYQDVGYTRSWLNNPGHYYYNRRNTKIEDEIRKKLATKKQRTPLIQPLGKGIAMVKAGGYAYHTETYNADTLISQTFDQTDICELGSLTSFEKTLLYPAVQRNSPYREFFAWSLTRLLERGVVSCIQRRTDAPSASCAGSSPRALTLGGAAPAFILLALGCLLGTCIMLVERLMKRWGEASHS